MERRLLGSHLPTLPPSGTKMTLEEFHALPETTQRTELIGGVFYTDTDDEGFAVSPKDPHQKTLLAVTRWFILNISVGDIRYAPLNVYINDDVVQPDLFWVSGDQSACRLEADGYWHGAPDLVIEILSRSTAASDRGEKFRLYRDYGVREYWIIDTQVATVKVYRRDETLDELGVYTLDETFESPTLAAVVSVDALLGR